jgi:hypothetical protein
LITNVCKTFIEYTLHFFFHKKQDAFETDNEIIAVTEYVPTGDLHKLFEIYKV